MPSGPGLAGLALSCRRPQSPPSVPLSWSGTSGASEGGVRVAWGLVVELWEPFSHVSKGRAHSGSEPGLSTQLVLRICHECQHSLLRTQGLGNFTSHSAELPFLCDCSAADGGQRGTGLGASGSGSLAEVTAATTVPKRPVIFPWDWEQGWGCASGPTAQAAGQLRGRSFPGCAHPPVLLLPRPPASPKRTVSPRDSRPASGGGRRPSISPHPGTLMSRPPNK